MKKLFLISHTLLVLASLHSLCDADVLITGRTSLVSTTFDFGYFGSVLTSTESKISTTIDDTQLIIQGSATDGGPLGDVSWDASYQFDVQQQLVPDSSRGFSGSSSTNLFAFAAGDGVSYLSSTNRLEVLFENTMSTAFELTFNATDTSVLHIEHMTGPGLWDNLFTIIGGYGEVATELHLATGVFRLTAQTDVATNNSFSNGGSWSFSITAVPEPSSMGLLAISTSWLIFGRRRMALCRRA